MKRITFVIFLSIIFGGCCMNEPYDDEFYGEVVSFVNLRADFMNCFKMGTEIIIRNKTDFQKLITYMEENDCECDDKTRVDKFNFDKYSILGRVSAIRGCNSYFIINVEFLNEERKVVYEISTGDCGFCNEGEIGSECTVIVPAIPADYEVEFVTDGR